MSCDAHNKLCNEYGIGTVPTLVLIPPSSPSSANDPSSTPKYHPLHYKEKNPKFIVKYFWPNFDTLKLSNTQRKLMGEPGNEEGNDDDDDNDDDKAPENHKVNQGRVEGAAKDDDDDDDREKAEEIAYEQVNQEPDEEENVGNDDDKTEENAHEEINQVNQDPESAEEETKDDDETQVDRGEQMNHEQIEDTEVEKDGDDDDDNNARVNQKKQYQGNAAGGGGNDDDGSTGEKQQDESNEEGQMIHNQQEGFDSEFLEDAEEANRDWDESMRNEEGPEEEERNLRMPPKVLAGGVVPGAGAIMKEHAENGMGRFQAALLERKNSLWNAFNRQDPLAKKHAGGGMSEAGGSLTMKAHTPGTPEYDERKQMIKAHVASLMKKKRLRPIDKPPKMSFSGGAGGASYAGLPFKKQLPKQKRLHTVLGKIPLAKRLVKLSKEEELILDSTMSFTTALKTGIYSDSNSLSGSKKKALQGWLQLLRVSLPPEWALHEVIMDLDNHIDFVSESRTNLIQILDKHPTPRKEWSHSCTIHGKDNAFDCGFWKLLHLITVGVAEHRGGLNLVEGELISAEAKTFSPAEAAEAMKEYIAYFYPCSACKTHFVAKYDQCSNRRCVRLTDSISDATNPDWMELAKWLWEFHNDVSVRLLEEKTNSRHVLPHESIKVLYPSLHECASCFQEDGNFNEGNIFLFLEHEYWPGSSEIDPKADDLFKFHNVEEEEFAYAWIFLFVFCGVLFICRPKICGVHRKKKRID